MMRFFFISLLLTCQYLAVFPIQATASPGEARVALTFDVESGGDAEALAALRLTVPATYFFTGEYAYREPELLRELVREGHTIGGHSHAHAALLELTSEELRRDLEASRRAIEELTCKRVEWFRAPFLKYNDEVMRQVAEAGFLYDSTDKSQWPVNAFLPEMAISNFENRLVGDFELIEGAMEPREFLDYLIRAFEAYRREGRPLVILLHPRIIGGYPDVLPEFIAHVRAEGGRFVRADDLLAEARQGKGDRGVWLEAAPSASRSAAVTRAVRRGDIDYLILPARTAPSFPSLPTKSFVPPEIAELRAEGLRVLVQIAPLDRGSAGKPHKFLPSHSRPYHPNLIASEMELLRAVAADPEVDGVVLAGLDYPPAYRDDRSAAWRAFSRSGGQEEGADALYDNWVRWQADTLVAFISDVRAEALGGGRDDFMVGAMLPPGVLLDFRAQALTGIDPEKIGPKLDLVLVPLPADAPPKDFLRVRLAATVLLGQAEVMTARLPAVLPVARDLGGLRVNDEPAETARLEALASREPDTGHCPASRP